MLPLRVLLCRPASVAPRRSAGRSAADVVRSPRSRATARCSCRSRSTDAVTDEVRAAISERPADDLRLRLSSCAATCRRGSTARLPTATVDRLGAVRQPHPALPGHAQRGRSGRGSADDRGRERGGPQWLTNFERLPLFSTARSRRTPNTTSASGRRPGRADAGPCWPWDRGGAWGHAKFTFLP